MSLIFHEKQEGSLCAQHCLNSLLQGEYYSAIDLAEIGRGLDAQERLHMFEGNANEPSSNYDDSGFFSIQVIESALKQWNLDLVPYNSQNEVALEANIDPTKQKAYICNFREHWYTIRRIGNYWFNLNSVYKRPQYVSETYLSVLLAQLVNDGYSIFIVYGVLPECTADQLISIMSREEVAREYPTISAPSRNRRQQQHNDNDDDIKRAIALSLEHSENEDKKENSYKHLIDLSRDEQEEENFRRAIELSLMNGSKNENDTKNADSSAGSDTATAAVPSSSQETKTNVAEQQDEIRKKRLEKFLNNNNNSS